MPKFKFTNSDVEVKPGVVSLPCKNGKSGTKTLSEAGADVTYEFDNDDTWVLRLQIPSQWLTIGDIDELQALLKAAKKRAVKLAVRNAEG